MIAPSVMKALVLSMNAPDDHVIRMHYTNKAGVVTERTVSPIRFIGQTAMMALCLSREEPRRFELDKCSKIELVDANDVLMPVEIRVIHDGSGRYQDGDESPLGDSPQAAGQSTAGPNARDTKGGKHRAAVFP